MSIRPDYYTQNGLEAFDVIKAFFMDKAFLSHAFKYMARAGRKGDEREDIRKAITYLEAHLETLGPDVGAPTEQTFGYAPFIDRANEVLTPEVLEKFFGGKYRTKAVRVDPSAAKEVVAAIDVKLTDEVPNLVELGKAWKAELRGPALDDENAHEEEIAYVTGGHQ